MIWARGYRLHGRGHVDVSLRGPTSRMLLDFPCQSDTDPSRQSHQLADQLTHTPPDEQPAQSHSFTP